MSLCLLGAISPLEKKSDFIYIQYIRPLTRFASLPWSSLPVSRGVTVLVCCNKSDRLSNSILKSNSFSVAQMLTHNNFYHNESVHL